ncbi:MAG: aspartate/glutamate racemase family protein [Steroidobacteraceae bacterium]
MRLLLINPNGSVHITRRMADSAEAAILQGERLTAITAEGHPAVVRCELTLQQANANALSMARHHAAEHDALLLAISLDDAVGALRRQHPDRVVVGMTEAALMCAALQVERIGVLTLGRSMLPMYQRRVAEIGFGSRVVAIEAPEMPLAYTPQAAGQSAEVLQTLVQAGQRLADQGAEIIVLAGAVLCGYDRALASAVKMPVLDGITCGVDLARCMWTSRQGHTLRMQRHQPA